MRFNVGVDFGRAGPPGGLSYWQGICNFLGHWPDNERVLASVAIPISPISVSPSIVAPAIDYGGARFTYQVCDSTGYKNALTRLSEPFVPQDNYTYTIVYYIGRMYTGYDFDLLMIMPMPPVAGPPLPIGLGIYWPWIAKLGETV